MWDVINNVTPFIVRLFLLATVPVTLSLCKHAALVHVSHDRYWSVQTCGDIFTLLLHFGLRANKPNAFLLCVKSKIAVPHYSLVREAIMGELGRLSRQSFSPLHKPGLVKTLTLYVAEYGLNSTHTAGKWFIEKANAVSLFYMHHNCFSYLLHFCILHFIH